MNLIPDFDWSASNEHLSYSLNIEDSVARLEIFDFDAIGQQILQDQLYKIPALHILTKPALSDFYDGVRIEDWFLITYPKNKLKKL